MKVTTFVPVELRPVAYAALYLITRDDSLIGIVGRYKGATRWTWSTVIDGAFRAGSADDAATAIADMDAAIADMDAAIADMEAADAPAA